MVPFLSSLASAKVSDITKLSILALKIFLFRIVTLKFPRIDKSDTFRTIVAICIDNVSERILI